ncbi:hypothetical protein HS088_TW19G00707 [Tripterygium wilfordii]|uniref:Uncharacterized protein n=1 Tax=Tripterygium wilfordii TaxID=458696 RepID=A0A7J7CAE8_TRIWF|nr:protein PSK SIMULATOR 1 [Tripterygium wilfordii]KAF5731103.1 hypothetical protein HS088_TW19G00707 [Tripterygium wilfordii]
MALETLLIKVKTAITHSFDSVKTSKTNIKLSRKSKSNVGVLSFEISSLMSKLLHLWQSLSDNNIIRLRNESIAIEGVRKIVSNDESFLIGLACAEMAENVRFLGKSISRLSNRCDDSSLRCFERFFDEFANTGHDTPGWVLSCKEMEAKNKKMDRYATVTAKLYKEMEELTTLEHCLKKCLQDPECSTKEQKIINLHEKIFWQRQEVKYLKERSLWNRSFDTVVSMLERSIFTILARIKLVFGVGNEHPPSLPRSLSASATVYPTENPISHSFVSGPLNSSELVEEEKEDSALHGFFESNSKLLKPPAPTLGAAALALHYANLIIVMEKMIKSPQLVGVDARDDLYAMLPNSIRSNLRGRLKGVGFSASDPVLAGEWRDALGKILWWLSPLAHNMIKWQSERSFEQQNLVPKTSVLLLQTLFFANKEKTEAAITELLVGLNYIWRFEREMTAKALFESANLNGFVNLQNSVSS